jgi:hypothetical protein
VKATSFVAAALLAAGNIAHAQEAPAPPDARPPLTAALRVSFPLLPVPPIAEDRSSAQDPQAPDQAPRAAVSPADRRDDIRTLEAVLTFALKSGAEKLATQMRAIDPSSLFLIDTGRTRGFDLQGYGVFFDVDVPMMKQSVLWSTRTLTQQDTRAQLQTYIATQPPGPAREFAIRELNRMPLVQQGQRQAGPTQIANVPEPGSVRAADFDPSTAAPPAPPADPNELYTEAVKTALIDAMLKHSLGLKLGPEEWLTVAARDAQGPLTPGQPDDASTIVIRIKGSDLAAFHANRLTPEEVRKRVEVKEY